MTYIQLKNKLSEAGIDSPSEELTILIKYFCGKTREEILADRFADYEASELLQAVEKRCAHLPLQYIIGEWEFYGCQFKVNENCLIPRYDTEITVQKVLELLEIRENPSIADLCTGSGCIAVSVLANNRDVTCVYALEKYEKTLSLAVENAKLNCVDGRFKPILADVFDGFLPTNEGSLDIIASNPPYIPTDVIKTLSDEVKREPVAALDGGVDGMDFYRFIIPAYKKYLKPDGMFVFEIGYDQGDAVKLTAERNGFDCAVSRDIDGHDRTAVLTFK